MAVRFFFTQLLIAIDQLANVLVGGYCDESLSSHAYRMQQQGKFWGFLCTLINVAFFDSEHCRLSYESEKLRLQSPPEER